MSYTTVFEITQKPFEWRYSAFGLIFVALGIVFILFGPQLERLNDSMSSGIASWLKPSFSVRPKHLGWFFVIFALGWTSVVFASTYSSYIRCYEAYRTGRFSVVEGPVEDFHPMPYTGHLLECFKVKNQQFCYSDYVVSPAFNRSTSHGGPIRADLPVRISYVDDDNYDGLILRLEIGVANSQ